MNQSVSNSRFKPYRLLAGGHRQTLAACYLTPKSEVTATVQHHIRLDDGDQLVLHDDCPPQWQLGDLTAMLVHGLCGSHRSRYMIRITNKLHARGVRVFRLDLRGSGAGRTWPARSRTADDRATYCRRSNTLANWLQAHRLPWRASRWAAR